MSNNDNIEKLRATTHKLLGLLEDPHPGLATWSDLFRRRCAEIAEFSLKSHLKSESVKAQAQALLAMGEDGWDASMIEDLCHEIIELMTPPPTEPICDHEFGRAEVVENASTSSPTHMVIHMTCKKCSKTGHISFGTTEVDWLK